MTESNIQKNQSQNPPFQVPAHTQTIKRKTQGWCGNSKIMVNQQIIVTITTSAYPSLTLKPLFLFNPSITISSLSFFSPSLRKSFYSFSHSHLIYFTFRLLLLSFLVFSLFFSSLISSVSSARLVQEGLVVLLDYPSGKVIYHHGRVG